MSVSRPDPAVGAAALLGRIAPRLAAPDAVLVIDGRSGSGKTTLAAWLAPRLHARVLHLEDVYPDWTGLDAAAALLAERLLPAFRAGRVAQWREWDWAEARYGRTRSLRPGGRLIVEGCGAVSAESARLADFAVVLEVAEPVRRERILRRDPADALPGHAVWAIAERRLAAARAPARHADLVLPGGVRTPRLPAALDTVSG